MDGFQARLNDSIQFRLAWGLAIAIVVVALSAGILSYYSAFNEAIELQDDILRQTAALVQDRGSAALSRTDPARLRDADVDSESRLRVQSLGTQAGASEAGLPIPATLADGLHTLQLDGDSYRVLIRTIAHQQRIAIAQETRVRDDIAQDSAVRTILPLLILVPVLLWVTTGLVRKMLRPVTRLAREIDRRSEHDLHPLRLVELPVEIRPFVNAINRMLGRVGDATESQRRFVADAAHELRSPLTALFLQAERLAAAPMSAEAAQRLGTLRQGIDRSRNLLEQMLDLARAQSAVQAPQHPVSVSRVFRRVLEDVMALADTRNIDIGIESDEDIEVWASELDLFTLVKNLVDNAIRYTPDGGRVDLALARGEQHALVRIQDSGPGIPASEWPRIFDPFYRTLGNEQHGSGLGLSIVQAIAARIGAEVALGFTDAGQQTGLAVTVRIPIGDAASGAARNGPV